MDQPFEVFFDGDCPLCAKEINFIRRKAPAGSIIFTDIASPSFDAHKETGLSFETLMQSIHGRRADGTLITGVEVFRELYGRLGVGPLVQASRLPGIKQGLDLAYTVFAKNRLRLTRRPGEACLRPSVQAED